MAAMKRKALKGEFEDGSTVTTISGIPEESKEEGQSLIYKLSFRGEKPTKRLKEFTKYARSVLEDEEF